jgi:hypothetical protein
MAEKITYTTQDHLDILEIKDNLVVLKNGIICAVLQTTAVNFDLLSEIEQDAIIAAFSMLLNSITFPVQVVLRSKKLDITKYVEKIQRMEAKITDPLMRHQAEAYRKFVQEVIKTNEVLDKKFYVIVPSGATINLDQSGAFDWVSKLFGLQNKRTFVNVDKSLNDAKIQLSPKVDHVIKEFGRIGVKSRQLSTQELVELYFDIYNPTTLSGQRIRTNIEDYKTAIVNPAIIDE